MPGTRPAAPVNPGAAGRTSATGIRGYNLTRGAPPVTAPRGAPGDPSPKARKGREGAPAAPELANKANETDVTVAASNRIRDRPNHPPAADICHGLADLSFGLAGPTERLRYPLPTWLRPVRDGRASA